MIFFPFQTFDQEIGISSQYDWDSTMQRETKGSMVYAATKGLLGEVSFINVF